MHSLPAAARPTHAVAGFGGRYVATAVGGVVGGIVHAVVDWACHAFGAAWLWTVAGAGVGGAAGAVVASGEALAQVGWGKQHAVGSAVTACVVVAPAPVAAAAVGAAVAAAVAVAVAAAAAAVVAVAVGAAAAAVVKALTCRRDSPSGKHPGSPSPTDSPRLGLELVRPVDSPV